MKWIAKMTDAAKRKEATVHRDMSKGEKEKGHKAACNNQAMGM